MDLFVDTHEMNLKNIQYWIKDYLRKKDDCILITDLIMDYLESERFPDSKSLICQLAVYGFLSHEEIEKLISLLWFELKRERTKQQERTSHSAKYQRTSSSSSSTKVNSRNSSELCDSYHKQRHSTKVYNDDDDWTTKVSGSNSKRVYNTEK